MMKALCERMFNAISGVIDDDAIGLEIQTMTMIPELFINHYVVFMGYLSLAIRGLGYLVLTWTTVVLLGGFVSMLNQKDFWCLTVITLVQTVGVLDVSASERLSNIRYSFIGLLISMLPSEYSTYSTARVVVSLCAALVQALVIVLVLCPLGAAYMLGLYISTGLSTWRLIQRDYVDPLDADPNKKNMRPALNVLYSLVLLQGGLFLYRTMFSTKRKAMTNSVARQLRLDEEAVTDYFRETTVGLEKDPSFARGWNLFTYAVDMLESRSSDRYLLGARLLHSLLHSGSPSNPYFRAKELLLGSMSTSNVAQKLLWTLDSAEAYGEEAREHAASIVEVLAGELRLEQFPRGLRRIESLLDNSNLELMLKGLGILTELAADGDNRQAMRNMPSLIPKIMAKASIEQHQSCGNNEFRHHAWAKVARPALCLLADLIDSPGESGAKLPPRQGSSMAIRASTMENIIKCNMCNPPLKQAANKILQDLPGDEARKNIIVSNMNKDEVVVPILPAEIEEGGC